MQLNELYIEGGQELWKRRTRLEFNYYYFVYIYFKKKPNKNQKNPKKRCYNSARETKKKNKCIRRVTVTDTISSRNYSTDTKNAVQIKEYYQSTIDNEHNQTNRHRSRTASSLH